MKIVSLKEIPEVSTSHAGVGKKKVMIAKGEVPGITQFAQVTLTTGEVIAEHVHEDMFEIFFVHKGKGIMRLNSKNYPIEKGMNILVEPRDLHEVTNLGPGDLVLTYFGVLEKEHE